MESIPSCGNHAQEEQYRPPVTPPALGERQQCGGGGVMAYGGRRWCLERRGQCKFSNGTGMIQVLPEQSPCALLILLCTTWPNFTLPQPTPGPSSSTLPWPRGLTICIHTAQPSSAPMLCELDQRLTVSAGLKALLEALPLNTNALLHVGAALGSLVHPLPVLSGTMS